MSRGCDDAVASRGDPARQDGYRRPTDLIDADRRTTTGGVRQDLARRDDSTRLRPHLSPDERIGDAAIAPVRCA